MERSSLESDCQTLKKLLKEKGEPLINFILSKTKRERLELRQAYQSYFCKDLLNDIDSALSHDFKKVVMDLFRSPSERDATYLYRAMKGVGTDEEAVIEVLCSRSNVEIMKIKEEYRQLFKEDWGKFVLGLVTGGLVGSAILGVILTTFKNKRAKFYLLMKAIDEFDNKLMLDFVQDKLKV
jgi:hypothetical protein